MSTDESIRINLLMTTDFTTVASENVCLSVKVTVNMEKKIFEKILKKY